MKRIIIAVLAMAMFSGCSSLDFSEWVLPEPIPVPTPSPDPTPIPEPTPEPIPIATDKQIAASWENGAAWREHNELSDAVSFVAFKRHVDEKKARGCNTINLYLMNQKDGFPRPTSFYAGGKFGGAVDQARINRMEQKIDYAYSVGMQINFWFLADDGGIPYTDKARIKQYLADCKAYLGSRIARAAYNVTCLESDEVFKNQGRGYIDEYAKTLHELFPSVKIANHMTSGKSNWSEECPYVDVVFFQVNPRKSIAACKKELKKAVKDCSKPVMACEISLHGKSDEARQKAKDALAVGCIGVHSGVPKS